MFLVACLQIGNALINLLIKSTTIRVPNPSWNPANPEAAPRQIEEKAFWHEVSSVVCITYSLCCIFVLMQLNFSLGNSRSKDLNDSVLITQ